MLQKLLVISLSGLIDVHIAAKRNITIHQITALLNVISERKLIDLVLNCHTFCVIAIDPDMNNHVIINFALKMNTLRRKTFNGNALTFQHYFGLVGKDKNCIGCVFYNTKAKLLCFVRNRMTGF